MRTNKENHSSSNDSESQDKLRTLRFRCPKCGGRELRMVLGEASHPSFLIQKLEVDPDDLDDMCVAKTGEIESLHSDEEESMRYECENELCDLTLSYEEGGEEREVQRDAELAQWLLKHCPQSDEDVPVNGEELKKD